MGTRKARLAMELKRHGKMAVTPRRVDKDGRRLYRQSMSMHGRNMSSRSFCQGVWPQLWGTLLAQLQCFLGRDGH